MPDMSWILTVSYDASTNTTTITDPNGGTGDEVIFAGESDQITFVPGTGVLEVVALSLKFATPSPARVYISQNRDWSNLVVTDSNRLLSTDSEADLSYSISFTDSSGNPHTTDPQLVNKPQPRGNALAPAARRSLPTTPRVSPTPQASPASPPLSAPKPGIPTSRPSR